MQKLIDSFARLSGLRDRVALMGAIGRLACDVTGVRCVAVWRWEPDAAFPAWTLVNVSHDGDAGRASRITRPRLDALAVADPTWRQGDAQPHRTDPARWFYALRSASRLIGAIEVGGRERPGAAQHARLRSLVRFFDHLHALLDENECDALTGLLNRKSFDEAFARIAFDAPERGAARGLDASRDEDGLRRWSLGVIDIDHFKRINDRFGHLIGDEVLIMLAQVMRSTLRADDRIYRFGGEEFVVLLRIARAGDERIAFERLRVAVERHAFPQVGALTVSTGCTTVRADDTPADAFGRADRAVYWVKENGRNQVRSHEELFSAGAAPDASSTAVEFF
jgi:diguanylate cyclase (GGDEF)-like protein